jgi:hypothetical protein
MSISSPRRSHQLLAEFALHSAGPGLVDLSLDLSRDRPAALLGMLAAWRESAAAESSGHPCTAKTLFDFAVMDGIVCQAITYILFAQAGSASLGIIALPGV